MGGEAIAASAKDAEKRGGGSPPTRVRALERRIRYSAVLLIVGLLIEAFSLHWAHPTAFVVFVGLGGTCIAVGILLFLYSILSSWQKSTSM
jgi:hypothetical protein